MVTDRKNNMNNARKFTVIALASMAVLSAGCSTHVSRDISLEGVAGEVIFPAADSATFKDGTFPNVESLRLVKPGVTKDQLYYLLGRPHFDEGFARVREWDYLFHFREGDTVRTCQYKVIFDKDYQARSFHWLPEDCAEVLADPVAPIAQQFMLEADALFAFDRSGMGDISAGGKEEIRAIGAKLASLPAAAGQVEVLAYTDRLGSAGYNLGLSQARAETVRAWLIDAGVAPSSIRAVGMGAANPVKTCSDSLSRPELISCLAPNRRVEIRAVGVR